MVVKQLRLHVERRLGEMMAEQEKAKGGWSIESCGFSNNPQDKIVILAQAGIDKNLAHRARSRPSPGGGLLFACN